MIKEFVHDKDIIREQLQNLNVRKITFLCTLYLYFDLVYQNKGRAVKL